MKEKSGKINKHAYKSQADINPICFELKIAVKFILLSCCVNFNLHLLVTQLSEMLRDEECIQTDNLVLANSFIHIEQLLQELALDMR